MATAVVMTVSSDSRTDTGGARHPRVAVDVLQRDQRAILFDGDGERSPPISPLTEPFENRQAVINWWQAACVRTFGHLRSVYPPQAIFHDGALTEALTAETPTPGQQHERQRIREHIMSACSTAYRDLETRANEWLADSNDADTDWKQIDPSEQRHVAMRPAFSRLDSEQATALQRLWGGFTSRDAVIEWTHGLPAVAEFTPVLDGETDLTAAVIRGSHALEQLTAADDPDAVVWRERFASTILLPAFGVRATKLQAGERAESTRTERTVPHG
jgi:hypothetical protein